MSNLFAVLIVAMVTVTELKTILKNEGVVGYSKLRKPELEALVERVQHEKAKDKKKKKKTYVEDFDSKQLVTKSKPKKSVKQADIPEDYHKLHSQFDLSKFDAEKAKQYYKDEQPIVERTLSPEEYEKYFGIKIPQKDSPPKPKNPFTDTIPMNEFMNRYVYDLPKPKESQVSKSDLDQLKGMRKKRQHTHQHNKMLFEQAERKLQREVKKKNQQKVLARKLPVKQIASKHDAATTEYLKQLNKIEKLLHENKIPAVTSDPYKRATQHAINALRNITNQPSYNSTWLPNYIKHTHFFNTFSDILDVTKIMELVPWYKASQTTQSSIQHSKPQSSILHPTLPKHLTHKKQNKHTPTKSTNTSRANTPKQKVSITRLPGGGIIFRKV